jgi:hypothetical protein
MAETANPLYPQSLTPTQTVHTKTYSYTRTGRVATSSCRVVRSNFHRSFSQSAGHHRTILVRSFLLCLTQSNPNLHSYPANILAGKTSHLSFIASVETDTLADLLHSSCITANTACVWSNACMYVTYVA